MQMITQRFTNDLTRAMIFLIPMTTAIGFKVWLICEIGLVVRLWSEWNRYLSNRSSSGLELDPAKQTGDTGKCSATHITATVVKITFQINDNTNFRKWTALSKLLGRGR